MPDTNHAKAPATLIAHADSIAIEPACDCVAALACPTAITRSALAIVEQRSVTGANLPNLDGTNSVLSDDSTPDAEALATVGVPATPTETEADTETALPRFAALRHRNFRLFWFGNLLSLVGTLA